MGLVDAFASSHFGGNPAGVCVVDAFPDACVMQNVAFELNWSETAFVKPLEKNNYHIRWFSPEDEAPICGHATLAAAHFLLENNFVIGSSVVFQSAAGPLTVIEQVYEQEKWLVMDFPAVPVCVCESDDEVASVKKVFPEDVQPKIKQVLKDSIIYVVVVENEADVLHCAPNLEQLKTLNCRAISVTAAATPGGASCGYDFVSRYFAPKVGIPEDPVCGSSHCRLTPFWAGVLNKDTMVARQLSRRRGVLQVSYDAKANRVSIAGQAKTVLTGRLSI
jgi:PhzF family phenazine biosynthesis protein